MKTKVKQSAKYNKISSSALRKIEKARDDYLKIWKDVEPFVRKRTITSHSTIGKWLSLNYEP